MMKKVYGLEKDTICTGSNEELDEEKEERREERCVEECVLSTAMLLSPLFPLS